MSDDLKVFEPIKPVGKCGACGRDLYPHSTTSVCSFREDCPMHGEVWQAYQMTLRMKNTRIADYRDYKPSDTSWQA